MKNVFSSSTPPEHPAISAPHGVSPHDDLAAPSGGGWVYYAKPKDYRDGALASFLLLNELDRFFPRIGTKLRSKLMALIGAFVSSTLAMMG
jgi:hypothetical protein